MAAAPFITTLACPERYKKGRQHDAGEFLTDTIDKLTDANRNWAKSLYYYYTSYTYHLECGHTLVCDSASACMILPIPDKTKPTYTLEELLAAKVAVNNTNSAGQETFGCRHFLCNGMQRGVLRTDEHIQGDRPPPVLFMQVNRAYQEGRAQKKNHCAVTVPLTIDMQPFSIFASGVRKSVLYQLRAYVIHQGATVTCGHYEAVVRDDTTGAASPWLRVSDDVITPADATLLAATLPMAYIVVWERA